MPYFFIFYISKTPSDYIDLLFLNLYSITLAAEPSGTTVTFVIIDGWTITVASVGDSRCILESADGSLYLLSADHRLDENKEE